MTRWASSPLSIGPAIQTFYEDFLNALTAFRTTDWAVTGMRYSIQSQDFSLPYALSPVIATGVQTPGPESQVRSLNFSARGQGSGRRSVYQVFGVSFQTSTDFRFQAGENANIDDAIVALYVGSTAGLVTIAGDVPLINQYANQRLNAYWQTESRG